MTDDTQPDDPRVDAVLDRITERVRRETGKRISRRDTMIALAALAGGAGFGGTTTIQLVEPASAGSQQAGTIGTASNPVDVHAEDLFSVDSITGPITGSSQLTDLAGSNLSINSGSLDASGAQPDVQDDGSVVVSGVNTLDFQESLNVTNPTSGEAEIAAVSVPWSEDGNSPIDVSATSATTYTLAGAYDHVLVIVESWRNTSGGNSELHVRVNGDSTTSYDWENGGATQVTGDSSWGLTDTAYPDGGELFGQMYVTGRWNENASANFAQMGASLVTRKKAAYGDNETVTSPLDSITFTNTNGNMALRARVYGLDT